MHASVSFYFAWALLLLRTALGSVFCATAVEASCDVFAESGKCVSCWGRGRGCRGGRGRGGGGGRVGVGSRLGAMYEAMMVAKAWRPCR